MGNGTKKVKKKLQKHTCVPGRRDVATTGTNEGRGTAAKKEGKTAENREMGGRTSARPGAKGGRRSLLGAHHAHKLLVVDLC